MTRDDRPAIPDTLIGISLPRLDGRDKATGSALYADDIKLPGMLHGKILRSPVPHARIMNIDTSRAAALPGVEVRDHRRGYAQGQIWQLAADSRDPGRISRWPWTRSGSSGTKWRPWLRHGPGHGRGSPGPDPGGIRGTAGGLRRGRPPWPKAPRSFTTTSPDQHQPAPARSSTATWTKGSREADSCWKTYSPCTPVQPRLHGTLLALATADRMAG